MRLDAATARDRFAAGRVARLATVGTAGRPHLVPVVFALEGDTVITAVDAKPKSTRALRRLADIAENPAVSLLVDHYEDDWSRLWWVRAQGTARVVDADDPVGRAALALLVARYPTYRDQPPPGPVIAISVDRWTGWSASG